MDSGQGYGSPTELPEVLGAGMDVLQNSQKFRVLWHGRTELTEVPGGYKKRCTRTPGCRTGRTELTEVPGTGMNVLQNSQKFRVRV